MKMRLLLIILLLIQLSCEKKINPNIKYVLVTPKPETAQIIIPPSVPSPNIEILIVESNSSTDLFEGTTTDSYTIQLKSLPSENKEVRINFDPVQLIINETQTSPLVINFTTTNWNTPQTITVRAVFDNIFEGPTRSVILHTQTINSVSSTSLGTIIANITDNSGSRLTTSFQSGTITLTAISTSISLTTPVNISKAYVNCNFQLVASGANRATTCQLNSTGTAVEITTGTIASNTIVNWYVVEFSIGALVQRNVANFSSTDLSRTISLNSSVDQSRTFVIVYSRTTDSSNNNDEQRTVIAKLTNQTTLNLIRQEAGMALEVEWQVVQLDGARVQTGESTISNSMTTTQATIQPINLNNSFIIINQNGSGNINGIETDLYVQASFIDSRNINFKRTGNQNSVTISWFAIEMIDGTTVQSGTVIITQTSTFGQVNLNQVEIGKTMIVISYRVETGNTPEATQDSGTFSSIFLNSTTIQFDRFLQENNICEITWYAVSYQ